MKTHKDLYHNASLLRRSITGDLNEEEQQQLNELLKDERMKSVYQKLSDGKQLKEELETLNQYSAEKAYNHFVKRQQREQSRKIYRIVSYAVACMLIIGCSLWLYRSELLTAPTESVALLPDETDSRKPKLILADGKEILLSQESNKSFKEQGADVSCEKGELKYHRQKEVQATAYNELQVPKGGECSLMLDDGTRVWINASSSLKYPVVFNGNRREVILEGEAYFEVTKDQRPFIVKTSYNSIRVLGTSFGISAYVEDSISYTTLVTGKVAVKTEDQMVEIEPGEQVVALADGQMKKREVNVNEYVGWKDGQYQFRNQRLENIMQTLERWYDLTIEFQEDDLKKVVFTGKLNRKDDIHPFLDALESTGELKYREAGKKVILYRD